MAASSKKGPSKRADSPKRARARVAVVIVTRDDPRLDACLESVLSQKPTFRFDVVVVDNDSAPAFRDAVRARWAGRGPLRFLHVAGPFAGAWNEGFRSTAAEIVARIDSDAVAHGGWLEALVRPLVDRADVAWSAGPAVGPDPPRSFTQRYYHYRTVGYQARLEGDTLPTDAVPSWNVAYRRSALEAVGGYDPWQRSSIDWDLHKRLGLRGLRGVFVPEAAVTHDHPSRLADFYRKEAWYRTGQYQMSRKYGIRAMREAFLLPAAYLGIVFLSMLYLVHPVFGWAAAGALALLVAKQWVSAALERDRVFWARPFYRAVEAAAALHGLLRGLFRYGLRRRPAPGAGGPAPPGRT